MTRGYRTRVRETVVIGDVHGCGEELRTLLARIDRAAPHARIVFVGDLLTKGPRPDLVVSEILERRQAGARIELVCGNHEPRALEALMRAGPDAALDAIPPRLAEMVDILADGDLLEDSIELMREALCTNVLRGPNGRWAVVHGGVDPQLGLDRTPPRRRVTIKGAPDEVDWWWSYDGRDGLLVVGHKPLAAPLVLRRADGRAVVVNVDTGCVYGGALSAYRIEQDAIISVPSRQRGDRSLRSRLSIRPATSAWQWAAGAPVRRRAG
jgi:hypothetical protein